MKKKRVDDSIVLTVESSKHILKRTKTGALGPSKTIPHVWIIFDDDA